MYLSFLLQVLQAVLQMYVIPENLFTQVCVIVDKVSFCLHYVILNFYVCNVLSYISFFMHASLAKLREKR
jgi:hypothetical protein